eukprot:g36642.t1
MVLGMRDKVTTWFTYGDRWDRGLPVPDSFTTAITLQPSPEYATTIAVSSRALFNMEEETKIFDKDGVEAYVRHQVKHENEPFAPGAAFPFVQ